MMRGTVTDFDEHVGLGVVRGEDGRELAFHCTAIADGSRSIEVGATVSFDIRPALPGRWEATGITATS